jgi:hypothetical protein
VYTDGHLGAKMEIPAIWHAQGHSGASAIGMGVFWFGETGRAEMETWSVEVLLLRVRKVAQNDSTCL